MSDDHAPNSPGGRRVVAKDVSFATLKEAIDFADALSIYWSNVQVSKSRAPDEILFERSVRSERGRRWA